MALSDNKKPIKKIPVLSGFEYQYPVGAGAHIYQGALTVLSASAGTPYLIPADDETSNRVFAGFAVEEADNSSGANGAINCKVSKNFKQNVVSSDTFPVSASNHTSTVYLEDDERIQLAPSGTACGSLSWENGEPFLNPLF